MTFDLCLLMEMGEKRGTPVLVGEPIRAAESNQPLLELPLDELLRRHLSPCCLGETTIVSESFHLSTMIFQPQFGGECVNKKLNWTMREMTPSQFVAVAQLLGLSFIFSLSAIPSRLLEGLHLFSPRFTSFLLSLFSCCRCCNPKSPPTAALIFSVYLRSPLFHLPLLFGRAPRNYALRTVIKPLKEKARTSQSLTGLRV